MDNKNQPAFPTLTWNQLESGAIVQETESEGISKREYFAAKALQGILANHWCQNDFKNNIVAMDYAETAQQAIGYADALIAELSKA